MMNVSLNGIETSPHRPGKRLRRIRVMSAVIVLICTLFATRETSAEEEGWRGLKTRNCHLLLQSGVDPEKVNDRIDASSSRDVIGEGPEMSGVLSEEEELAVKCEMLLGRVKEILDMYPAGMKVKIRIYRDQGELDKAFYKIFSHRNDDGRISFYVHKYTTVYASQDTVRNGVLAHEMGHSVIDHYFLVLPPASIKEVLAQYVETHLEE